MEYLNRIFTKNYRFILSTILLFNVQEIYAVEIIATKADTFISQAFPEGEFSKSDFLTISSDTGEKAITYIPFEIDAQEVGIQTNRDTINSASLILFAKSLPSLPKTNAIATKGISNLSPEDSISSPNATLKKLTENTNDKIENLGNKVIRIEIFGVIDEETFVPNSKNYRVSWNGQRDAAAPKHNTQNDKLDYSGLTKLGVLEIDTSEDNYEDGDRIEFQSDELTEYISFCYGIMSAKKIPTKFRSSLTEIRNATIVLRQLSGPNAILFYSSDSLGETSDKSESGEQAEDNKAKVKDEESDDDQPTVSLLSQMEEERKKIDESKEKLEVEKEIAKLHSSGNSDFNFSLNVEAITGIKQNKDESNEKASDDETPDRRPRISFEFRADPQVEVEPEEN